MTSSHLSLTLTLHELQAKKLPIPSQTSTQKSFSKSGSAGEIYFSATIDDLGRFTDRLHSLPHPSILRFTSENSANSRPPPKLHWDLQNVQIRRIRAHAPRLRVSIVWVDPTGEAEVCVGFFHVDFRHLEPHSGSKQWIPVHGDGVTEAKLLTTIALTQPNLTTDSNRNKHEETTLAKSSEIRMKTEIPAAFTGDRIVIGSRAGSDFTVSVTLRSGSCLEGLGEVESGMVGGGKKRFWFWLEYYMFGIEICTERFRRLDNARFASIRDSFKVRSCWEDLATFLCDAPVAVVVNAVVVDRQEEKEGGRQGKKVKGERVFTLGVATVRFDSLFKKGGVGVERTGGEVSCACAVPVKSCASGKGEERRRGGQQPVIAVELCVEWEDAGGDGDVDEAAVEDVGGLVEMPESAGVVNEEESVGKVEGGKEEREEIGEVVDEEEVVVDADEDGGMGGRVEVERSGVVEGGAGASTRKTVLLSAQFVEYAEAEDCDVYVDVQGERRPAERKENPLRFQFEIDPHDPFVLVCVNKEDPSDVLCEIPTGQFAAEIYTKAIPVVIYTDADRCLGQVSFQVVKRNEDEGRFTARVRIMAMESLDLTERDVYVQYAYPLFGIDPRHAVRTKPAVRVNRMDYRKLPHGDHEFEFVASGGQISTAAKHEPVVFQVCDADGTVLGEANLLLKQVLLTKPEYRFRGRMFSSLQALDTFRATTAGKAPNLASVMSEKPELLRSLRTRLIVHAANGDAKLALLHLSIHLIDHGVPASKPKPTPQQQPKLKPVPQTPIPSTPLEARLSSAQADNGEESRFTASPVASLAPLADEHELYKRKQRIALQEQKLEEGFAELERWRRAVEQEVVELERSRLADLEAEWAKQEYERVRSFEDAKLELAELQSRARTALTDAEKRERQVRRLEQDLRRAAELKAQETELICRRLREEFEHKKKLQKDQISSLEKRLKRTLEGNSSLHKRCQKVEEEFAAFREKSRKTAESVLLQEKATLKGEKKELQARLDAERKRCEVEEVRSESLKQQLKLMSKRLKVQERAENLAHASNAGLRRIQAKKNEDFAKLQRIRNELRLLQVDKVRDAEPTEEVTRLVQERRKIMATGLYSEDDPLVRELDKKIHQAGR